MEILYALIVPLIYAEPIITYLITYIVIFLI